MNNIVTLSNIQKKYKDKNLSVIKNINFKFQKGKIYSISGPSGSGKSTLLNLISLIDSPTKGKIKIDNTEITNLNNEEKDKIRSNKIGIIYQDKNLLNDFTALENIYLASLAAGNDKDSSINKSKILLRKVGLTSRSNHYPSQLSGGEKQRVSIARALINNPQIILADEPTGSLDSETAKSVFEILKKQINPNRLIVFATHNRYFADKSDYLLEIVNGNINTINA